MDENKALWAAGATSFLAQSTIEVLDGFSAQWGFSISDFTANLIGIGGFVTQEALWHQQKILLKVSSSPIDYNQRYGNTAITARANELYGSGGLTTLLKDYNAQTTWLSFNLRSFVPRSKVPEWLNVSLGYGAENLFGGFSNQFEVALEEPPQRYSQFYLSLDADLSRIKTSSPFIRTVLDILNVLKVPFSSVEVNTRGEVRFHIISF